jgi:hypothetical protein
MSKNTQMFTLFNILKGAGDKGVTKEKIAEVMGVKEVSVPVYLFELKKNFKAQLETVKNGRTILLYKLINADKIVVPQHRKGAILTKKVTQPLAKGNVPKAVKASGTPKKSIKEDSFDVATLDPDIKVTEISDREFADIKSSLGLF